jgi:DNA mismatch repair protein MutS
VTQRAKEILKDVENMNSIAKGKDRARYTQLMLFGSEPTNNGSPVIDELKNLNVDAMTPLDALNALAALKKMIAEENDIKY